MELELTEEQSWISESIDTLLSREWVTPQDVSGASAERRRQTWTALVEFGSFGIKKEGEDGLGAVELCLIARSLGSHLASVPFLGSAAVRLALAPQTRSLPAGIAALLSMWTVTPFGNLGDLFNPERPPASWSQKSMLP